jgi:sugar/nucleoside kinase (ribokinase family)
MDDKPVLDPLRALRGPGDPATDVYLTGTVFLDIIFTGLDTAPVRGTESWARGMGSSPGGIANMATALARLGLRTTLAAAFGDDMYGDYCWDCLREGEGIDLTPSRRIPGWHSPVTVSMAYEGERTMVSHGHQAPPPEEAVPTCPPPARAAVASLGSGAQSGPAGGAAQHRRTERDQQWIAEAAASGTKVFADVGWDETGRWDPADLDVLRHCAAFLPNAEEAMRYTRAATPREAARKLAELVPLAVVTLGAEGACAVDSATGETAEVPALLVEALDPTGAGDVFVAGFVTGTLAGWRLTDRLAFASLCAALSVQEFGGSLSAPGWIEIAGWWQQVKAYAGEAADGSEALYRYGFLEALLPAGTRPWPLRRAVPTIGFRPA